eukprot:305781-Chlamydomonas_euryale.AAC.3
MPSVYLPIFIPSERRMASGTVASMRWSSVLKPVTASMASTSALEPLLWRGTKLRRRRNGQGGMSGRSQA